VQQVEELIRADRITIYSVATALGCSHGLAYRIMHDRLKFRKVCARCVPKKKWTEWVCPRNTYYERLNRIVTGDDSWVHQYQPESKRASIQWKHPSSPSTKKFTSTPPAGKVMLTVFWDPHGVLLGHFQKRGENVNSASYWEVLFKLRDAIRSNVQANRLEGYCFIMTMPDRIQPEESKREIKNCNGNFLNIRLTAWT
jgi:hypothetical protein